MDTHACGHNLWCSCIIPLLYNIITSYVALSSTFVTHPVDTSAAAPFSAVFTCSVYGYGHQHITWHKKSGQLPYNHKLEQLPLLKIVTSTLIILNVTEQDAGEYYCQVWANHIGSQSKRANLYYSGILIMLIDVCMYVCIFNAIY